MCISVTLVQQDAEIQCCIKKETAYEPVLVLSGCVCMLGRSHIQVTAVAVCWRLRHLRDKDITYFVCYLTTLSVSRSYHIERCNLHHRPDGEWREGDKGSKWIEERKKGVEG
jgi:hypothetical protein